MEGCGDLLKALAVARKKFGPLLKNKTGQARAAKYGYADLASVLEAVEAPLEAEGIQIIQAPVCDDHGFRLVTSIVHSSGQELTASYPLPSQATSQEMGSALTYSRRYSICSLLSLVADEDDDGAAASAAPKQAEQKAQPKPPPKPEPKLVAKKVESNEGLASGLVDKISHLDTPIPHNCILMGGVEFLLPDGKDSEEKRKALENLKNAQLAMLKKNKVVIEFHLSPKGAQIVDAIKVEG